MPASNPASRRGDQLADAPDRGQQQEPHRDGRCRARRANDGELAERRQRLTATHRISVRSVIAGTLLRSGSSRPGRAAGSPAPWPGRRSRRRQLRRPCAPPGGRMPPHRICVRSVHGPIMTKGCNDQHGCNDRSSSHYGRRPWTHAAHPVTVRVVRVFTRDGGGGNHLGIHDGLLTDGDMQLVATELGFSETIFIDDLGDDGAIARAHLHAGAGAALRRTSARRRDVASRHARGGAAHLRCGIGVVAGHRSDRGARRASRWPTCHRSSAPPAPGAVAAVDRRDAAPLRGASARHPRCRRRLPARRSARSPARLGRR